MTVLVNLIRSRLAMETHLWLSLAPGARIIHHLGMPYSLLGASLSPNRLV